MERMKRENDSLRKEYDADKKEMENLKNQNSIQCFNINYGVTAMVDMKLEINSLRQQHNKAVAEMEELKRNTMKLSSDVLAKCEVEPKHESWMDLPKKRQKNKRTQYNH